MHLNGAQSSDTRQFVLFFYTQFKKWLSSEYSNPNPDKHVAQE